MDIRDVILATLVIPGERGFWPGGMWTATPIEEEGAAAASEGGEKAVLGTVDGQVRSVSVMER